MSLREEDGQKNTCPSRGLGIAAAAIGVGVGAALYYFFNKRPENPSSGGSTSRDWNCESQSMLFDLLEEQNHSDSSYTTISVNTTTDTSMYEDETDIYTPSDMETDDDRWDMSTSDEADTDLNRSNSDRSNSDSSNSDTSSFDTFNSDTSNFDTSNSDVSHSSSSLHNPDDLAHETSFNDETDSDMSQWDILSSTLRSSYFQSSYLEHASTYFPHSRFSNVIPIRAKRDEIRNSRSSQAFRERAWTLEECSICFDVILHSQEVMSLPCTHHFHQACILPWLQEKQTCPNCRKPID